MKKEFFASLSIPSYYDSTRCLNACQETFHQSICSYLPRCQDEPEYFNGLENAEFTHSFRRIIAVL